MYGKPYIRAVLASCFTFALAWIVIASTSADEPVAIIEEIAAVNPSVQAMQYVERGEIIKLGSSERIVIGYLTSCIRETIVGGSVVIGDTESNVVGGTVKRQVVECHGGDATLSPTQAARSGVIVFRKPPRDTMRGDPNTPLVIYSRSPVFTVSPKEQVLHIKRLDAPAKDIAIPITESMIDLLKLGITLAPGGLYSADTGDRKVTFEIHPAALDQAGPLLSRLVRL